MTKLILILLLIVSTASCLAQSNLVLYDANSTRVGIIMEASNDRMLLRTDDGYLFAVLKSTGEYQDYSDIEYVYYEESDCTGQLWVILLGGSGGLFAMSGRIFQVRPKDSDIFVRTEYGLIAQQPTVKSRMSWNGLGRICDTDVGGPTDFIPGTEIPPPDGLPAGPGDIDRVYPLPFTAKVEKSDGIFCDGFESCPTQP